MNDIETALAMLTETKGRWIPATPMSPGYVTHIRERRPERHRTVAGQTFIFFPWAELDG